PVALHDLRSRDAQLAGLAERQLARAGFDVDDLHVGVWKRQADCARPANRELRRRVRDGRGLRQPVAFRQRPPDAALELVKDFHGARGAAAVVMAYLLEAVLGDPGV